MWGLSEIPDIHKGHHLCSSYCLDQHSFLRKRNATFVAAQAIIPGRYDSSVASSRLRRLALEAVFSSRLVSEASRDRGDLDRNNSDELGRSKNWQRQTADRGFHGRSTDVFDALYAAAHS